MCVIKKFINTPINEFEEKLSSRIKPKPKKESREHTQKSHAKSVTFRSHAKINICRKNTKVKPLK